MGGVRNGNSTPGGEYGTRKGKPLRPPDGGWGWMVALGMALMFISTTGQYGSFGLLFEGILKDLGEQTTGATLIMNALAASVNFTGLVTSHLLKSMSYRMVALLGGMLFTVGIMLTLFANSMIHIVICYSIIAGIGLGLVAPSSYLAVNSYFVARRGFAMGLCQAGIGLGFIAAPPVVQALLGEYGFRGTVLILAGIALHSILGALLYQPVQWHLVDDKGVTDNEESNGMEEVPLQEPQVSLDVVPDEDDDLTTHSKEGNYGRNVPLKQVDATVCEEDHVVISRRGSLVMSTGMTDGRSQQQLLLLLPADEEDGSFVPVEMRRRTQQQRPSSVSLANVGSNVLMFDSAMLDDGSSQQQQRSEDMVPLKTIRKVPSKISEEAEEKQQSWILLQQHEQELEYCNGDNPKPCISTISTPTLDPKPPLKRCLRVRTLARRVAKSLDLGLLCDPIYVNIVLGLSVSFVSDTNFFTVFPFHLQDSSSLRFSGEDTALCMSIAAGADVAARLVLPWTAERFGIGPRISYLFGCLSSAVARSVFAVVDGLPTVAFMSGLIGFLKGAMVVNLSLTIAEHCPIERFGAAYSLYMVINGLITVCLGPLIGVVRDKSQSYPFCIHLLSAILLLCTAMWIVEYAWFYCRGKSLRYLTHALKKRLC